MDVGWRVLERVRVGQLTDWLLYLPSQGVL